MSVKLSACQVFPPTGAAILVSTRPNTVFVDGKPTDRVDGIRCECRALPDFSPVTVKVPGAAAPLSNAEIEAKALLGEITWVEFTGFNGVQWVDRRTQEIRVSGSAAGVKLTVAPGDLEVM